MELSLSLAYFFSPHLYSMLNRKLNIQNFNVFTVLEVTLTSIENQVKGLMRVNPGKLLAHKS